MSDFESSDFSPDFDVEQAAVVADLIITATASSGEGKFEVSGGFS
jgi:hypothetical protein